MIRSLAFKDKQEVKSHIKNMWKSREFHCLWIQALIFRAMPKSSTPPEQQAVPQPCREEIWLYRFILLSLSFLWGGHMIMSRVSAPAGLNWVTQRSRGPSSCQWVSIAQPHSSLTAPSQTYETRADHGLSLLTGVLWQSVLQRALGFSSSWESGAVARANVASPCRNLFSLVWVGDICFWRGE